MEKGYGFCEDADLDAELTAAWMVGGLHRFLEAAWSYDYPKGDAEDRWRWLQKRSKRYLKEVADKVKAHIEARGYKVAELKASEDDGGTELSIKASKGEMDASEFANLGMMA